MTRRLLFALVATFALAGVALGDSWSLPKVRTIESANGQFRFVVTPRGLASRLAFFQDTVAGKASAGQDPEAAATCRGRLEQRNGEGEWALVWERQLTNDVAPVTVLVADSGRHVVTFDNWHSLGYGPDTVVLYGADGTLVRALGLRDFLPEERVAALPRTVSSLHWGRGHRFSPDGENLVLQVVPEGSTDLPSPDTPYEPVRIRLSDGEVIGASLP